jgi:type IV secretion system protein VirD4
MDRATTFPPARLRIVGKRLLLATAAIIVIVTVGALTGIPQSLYRRAYVTLAYPVEMLDETAAAVTNKPASHITWDAWAGDSDARYAWLHTPGHADMGPVIALEALAPTVILALVAWRVGWFVYTRPRRLAPSTAHGSARWMTAREMRALPYTGAPLLLGTRDGHTMALDRDLQVLNVLLVGPPNTGKSAGFIIPNLRREQGNRSIIVTDLKNELLRKCHTALSRRHEVWVLNFLSPETSLGYNPLAYCTDPLATALFCDAWIFNTGKSEKDPFWDNAAREVLMSGIVHLQAEADERAKQTGQPVEETTLAHLDNFLTGQTPQQVIAALEGSASPLAKKKARSFMASLKSNDKLLGSVYAEITPRFMIMADARVQAVTSRNEIDFRRMVDAGKSPVALFMGLDRTLQTQLKPLIAAFFLDMFRTFSQIADESATDALARDVFLYADEFGNLGAVPAMSTWISTMRSAGVGMVLAVQSTRQIEEIYGEKAFDIITGSCYTKIGLSHMGWKDAQWFSDQAGQKTEVTQSSNVQRGRFHVTTDRGGASQSETRAKLLNPDEIQRIGETELVALIGERPPVRLTQRRYFDDDEVRGLDGHVPPLGPPRAVRLTPPVVEDLTARVSDAIASLEGEAEQDATASNDDDNAQAGAAATTATGDTEASVTTGEPAHAVDWADWTLEP